MEEIAGLSLEQELSLKIFQSQVSEMNREQAITVLVEMYEKMLVRENQYREVLKKQWGL